jgi:hypothetical protein
MVHECEECGALFETLSRLRLHECSPALAVDTGPADLPPADDWSGEDPPAAEEYPTLVGDLPDLVDDARGGDLGVLYRTVAEYERVLGNAPTGQGPGSPGPAHAIRWEYHEPLAEGMDIAAQTEGWDVLTEFVDAYDPRDQDSLPEAAHVIANAVGRSVVRTRLSEGVDAIPGEALAYLGAIPEYSEDLAIAHEESYTYGWGIGHSNHSVSDQLVEVAGTAPKWTSIALNTAFYADQYAAVEALERLATTDRVPRTVQRMTYEVDATRYYFGAADDLELETFGPQVPLQWDWEAELEFSFELDPEVKDRIRELAHETGIVDELPENWTLSDLEPGPLSGLKEMTDSRDSGH